LGKPLASSRGLLAATAISSGSQGRMLWRVPLISIPSDRSNHGEVAPSSPSWADKSTDNRSARLIQSVSAASSVTSKPAWRSSA